MACLCPPVKLCAKTHKKNQNVEFYKLKTTHKPHDFSLISSGLFLSLRLLDGQETNQALILLFEKCSFPDRKSWCVGQAKTPDDSLQPPVTSGEIMAQGCRTWSLSLINWSKKKKNQKEELKWMHSSGRWMRKNKLQWGFGHSPTLSGWCTVVSLWAC